MRICGNLDIETAMWRCLEYLETVMPVTGMSLHLFDRDFVTIQTIAQVTRYKEDVTLDRKIPLPREASERLKRKWTKMQMRDVTIFNRPDKKEMRLGSCLVLIMKFFHLTRQCLSIFNVH